MTEYGRIHTDGSRSGGQPLQSDVERVARALVQADGIEICSDATYALSSYGHKAQAALAAMRQAATQERAKIVAWLAREEEDYPSGKYSGFAAVIREKIEAGEHLK
jgi:hypothetical protein